MKQVCKIASSSRCIGLAALSSPAIQVKVNESPLGSLSWVIERSRMFLTKAQKRCVHPYQILERVVLLILTVFHLEVQDVSHLQHKRDVSISDIGESSIVDSHCFLPFSSQNCFELFNANCKGQKIKACKTDGDGRVVEGKHQSYKISAASQEDRDLWIEAIQ